MAFAVPSPIGENVTRLRGIVLPLALLAAAIAAYRPRWLAGSRSPRRSPTRSFPTWARALHRGDTRSAEAAFWEPALDFLAERWARTTASRSSRRATTGRPTGSHVAGFPLARGWYRQLDIAQNPLFYEEPLEPEAYRAWLDDIGVRWVLLPDTQLGRVGEEREAELLRSGRSGLEEVGTAG